MPLHLLGFSRSADVCRTSGVEWVVQGELAAAVSPLPPPLTPLQHAAHLAAIYRHGDILPMRFGAVLPDANAVGNFVGREQDELREHLDRLRGTAEIGVRIELCPTPPPPSPPPDSPAQYLTHRRARYQSQDQLDLRARLTPTTAQAC